MILTDEEPRLGSWPGLCIGLNGQAERGAGDMHKLASEFSPMFFYNCAICWGTQSRSLGNFAISQFPAGEQSPAPVLTRPKCWTLNGTNSNCSLGRMWLYLPWVHPLPHADVSAGDSIGAAGCSSVQNACDALEGPVQEQTSLFAVICLYCQQLQREAKKDQTRVVCICLFWGWCTKCSQSYFYPK